MAAITEARPAETGAAGAGEPTALQRFIASHYDDLRCRLVAYLGSEDLAGDSLHDVWLRLATSQAAEVRNPGAYVFRMAATWPWTACARAGAKSARTAMTPACRRRAGSGAGGRGALSCCPACVPCRPAQPPPPSCWPAAWKTCRRAALRYGITVDSVMGEGARAPTLGAAGAAGGRGSRQPRCLSA